MQKFIECIGYLAMAGILSFLVGRVIPKQWIRWEAPLFRLKPFEQGGRIYDRFYIRKWKDSAPDMNKILPALMPGRSPAAVHSSKEEVEGLIRETCVAEIVHLVLAVAGFWCVKIWRGWPGLLVAVLNGLGNLPFVMIQRYNRPRFVRIYRRYVEGEKRAVNMPGCEGETA